MDIRAHVVALNEKRLNVWSLLQTELDNTKGRDRSEEETAKIIRMDADIDAIDAEVREFVSRETREQENAALRELQAKAFGRDPDKESRQDMNVDAQLRAWLAGSFTPTYTDETGKTFRGLSVDIRGVQKERELMRAGASAEEIRAIAWDTGSSASLVPTNLARTLYQYMEASIAMFRMPTTKLTTASGESFDLPKLGAHAIATQTIAQGTAFAGTDPTFARMRMDAFKYNELVKVASEVITDSGIDISSFLGKDIGRALGRVIDIDLVVGTGSNEPNGIMTSIAGAGTIATGGSLITPTVEKMIDLQYSVIDEYRNDPSCAWLMNDSTAGTLRKLRDGAGGTIGAFLWAPSLTMGVQGGQPDKFLDKPVYTDPNVAAAGSNAKTVAFGAMSAYYVRQVGNPTIESDASRFFDTDEIAFRGKWRVDGDTIDTTAINVIKQNV